MLASDLGGSQKQKVGRLNFETGTAASGTGGFVCCIVGQGRSGIGGGISVTAGITAAEEEDRRNSGGCVSVAAGAATRGGDGTIAAGDGASASGGSIDLRSGSARGTSSGEISLATAESTDRGVSGFADMRTGCGTCGMRRC